MKDIFRNTIRFLNSRFLSNGLRMTIGVTVPTLLFAFQGELIMGITASVGALCVGITDVPGVFTHKRNGILIACAIVFVGSLITALATPHPLLLYTLIIAFTFFFSMFSVYGSRAGVIGLAALLSMILSMEYIRTIDEALQYSLVILGGSLWYALLTLTIWQIRPYLLARQNLSDCISKTAEYMRVKADFYTKGTDFDDNFKKLVGIQVEVNEKQEDVRETLLKRRSAILGSNSASRSMVLTFVEIVDLMEQAMASHFDYKKLHDRFDDTAILDKYHYLIKGLADELENIATITVTGVYNPPRRDFMREIGFIRDKVDELKKERIDNVNIDGFIALKNILRNAEGIVHKINKLYAYIHPVENVKLGDDYNKLDINRFTTRQRYDFKILRNNLSFESSIFRHALRVTAAVIVGLIVAKVLHIERAYWILMTTIVIMKPGFGITKQRSLHRVIGTILGALAGILLIFFVKNTTALVLILLLCIFLTYTLINYNYRLAVFFLTPFVLLLYHLISPGNYTVITLRVMDTAIGGGIAFVAGYVLWPRWEYTQLKPHMVDILQSNRDYFGEVANAYTGQGFSETAYKLARKKLNIDTANLGAAFQRMLTEPKSKQKGSSQLYHFVVLNHVLSSHIATLAAQFKNNPRVLQNAANFESIMEKCKAELDRAVAILNNESLSDVGGEQELPRELQLFKKKLAQLTEERLHELREGKTDSTVRAELTYGKILFDGFSNILETSMEIGKLTPKLNV